MTTGNTDSSTSCYRNRAMKQQQREQWLLETRLTNSMLQKQSNEATAAWAMTTGDTTHQQHATETEQWSNSSVSNDYWRHDSPTACYRNRAMKQQQREQWLLETRLTNSMLQEHNNEVTAAWAMTTGNIDSPSVCYRNRAIKQQQREQRLLETQTRQQHATETEQ